MNEYVRFFLHWYWLSFLGHFVLLFAVAQCAMVVRFFRKSVSV